MASEHAAMLKESVADFIARGMDIGRVRKLRGTPGEYDRAVWKQMADLGWLGIAVPEAYGGMGLGLAETAIVAEGLGRALAPEPYTACAVLAATILAESDNEPLKADVLPRIAGGDLIPAVAWQEQAGAADGAHVALAATPFEGGYRLNGTKRYVVGAAGADAYIVAGKADGGLVLGYLDRHAAGVRQELEPLADGRHFGTLALDDALVPRERVIATGDAAAAALSRALDRPRAVASAELN
jgi:alkylation response protein AidB-like acyl-CoA dehydrogenase